MVEYRVSYDRPSSGSEFGEISQHDTLESAVSSAQLAPDLNGKRPEFIVKYLDARGPNPKIGRIDVFSGVTLWSYDHGWYADRLTTKAERETLRRHPSLDFHRFISTPEAHAAVDRVLSGVRGE
jgi:hypothetical protein